MHTTTTIAVVGASGRMGRAVIDAAMDPSSRCRTVLEVDAKTLDPQAFGAIDCVIDFSSALGAIRAARLATEHGAALLSCTTGLDEVFRNRMCPLRLPVSELGLRMSAPYWLSTINSPWGVIANPLGD